MLFTTGHIQTRRKYVLDLPQTYFEEMVLLIIFDVTCLWQKRAIVVRGPTDVRNRELIFLQFSRNETEEDFSAISYMIFAKFSDMLER